MRVLGFPAVVVQVAHYQPRARARIGYKTGSTALLSRCLGVPDGSDFRLKNNQTGRPMQEFLLRCFPL
ncbi:hypothetical protein AZ09_14140 [Acetobacter aceti 1023]|nr:hypothetical protein AZ09_14140 [Acetobacter aceti 1023]